MGQEDKGRDESKLTFNKYLIELLGKLSEIELDDVELNIGDLEISLQPSVPFTMAQLPATKPAIPERVKPTQLLTAEFKMPVAKYLSQITEVQIGNTKTREAPEGSPSS